MTAIAPTTVTGGNFAVTGTAQANTGQTSWIYTPSWATHLFGTLEVTAAAGTTPLTDLALKTSATVSLDDGFALNLGQWDGITQIAGTTAGDIMFAIGPGITGIADDDTGPMYSVNTVLPPIIGVAITLDRTTGDETYTYALRLTFRG